MGVGPVYAIPLALKTAGLQVIDIDLFEVSNKKNQEHHRLPDDMIYRLMKLLHLNVFTVSRSWGYPRKFVHLSICFTEPFFRHKVAS